MTRSNVAYFLKVDCRASKQAEPPTPDASLESLKFWGDFPGEDVWPVFDGTGYFDPRTGERLEKMTKLRR